MKAVLNFEKSRNWSPERQPHFNPGYDVKSTKGQEIRLIEVKGLAADWTERGVKLSKTQINMNINNRENFWLYVVENALDLKKQKLHAIRDPFFNTDEFWFDYVWKELSDESGGDLKSYFVSGRKIEVSNFGVGEITEVKKGGYITYLTVKFGNQTKTLPYNTTTMNLVEDE